MGRPKFKIGENAVIFKAITGNGEIFETEVSLGF